MTNRSTRDDVSPVPLKMSRPADLRLFRFAATDDDTEFYVRCASKAAALGILMERAVLKRLKLQPRKIEAMDKVGA